MTDVEPAVTTPAGPATGQRPAPEGGATHAAPTAGSAEPGTLRQLARPACYYLASRLVILAVTAVAALVVPGLHVVHTLGTIFDGRWYVLIARHGYPHHLYQEGYGSRWAFFPAFPLVIRGVAEVTRLPLAAAGVVAAFVLGLSAALAVWLAVREILGPRLADRTVLLLVCFPTAYVFSLAYTEGLFLTAAALCLLALTRRAWIWAGAWACLAGSTRNAGVVVVLAVVVTALPAAWRRRSLRPLVGAGLAPLGLIAFLAYAWAMVGTPTAFLAAERFWFGQHFVWFVTPVRSAVAALREGPFGASFVPDALAGAALAFGFLGVWWLDRMSCEPGLLVDARRRSLPAAWWVYSVGSLLAAYSAYFSVSIARYTMAAFPLLAALAWRFRAHRVWPLALGLGLVQVALFLDVLRAVQPVVDPLVP